MYVGYTARRKEQEDRRWLTQREKRLRSGAKYKGGRNRPVLQYKDKLTRHWHAVCPKKIEIQINLGLRFPLPAERIGRGGEVTDIVA
jgi:hypothetical protein